MKICVLFESDIHHIRGEFMAIHNRLKCLAKDPSMEVSVFVIDQCFDCLTNWIKGKKQKSFEPYFDFEGVHYQCLYYKRSYLDFLFKKLTKYQTNVEFHRIKRFENLFKGFDLIYAHSLYTGLLGISLKKRNGVPVVVMWHGSSIHTLPFQNKTIFKQTRSVIIGADYNFFVSKELLETAKKIAGQQFVGSVSLNGVDVEKFHKYPESQREEVAKSLQFDIEKYNIAFVGNYLPIKNVQFLPKLFSTIYSNCKNARFHIVGNGKFENDFANIDIPIRYWGNQPPKIMPDIYNCMDLVVMPSINEGLPMTCLEALACGSAFVGSRVGGIADVVGLENTIPFTPSFEEDFISLCVAKTKNKDRKNNCLPDCYKVENIMAQEQEVFSQVWQQN